MINSLLEVIESNNGSIVYNQQVMEFVIENKTVSSVIAKDFLDGQEYEYAAENIICNMDPKKAAQMIGSEHLSHSIQKKLNYEY